MTEAGTHDRRRRAPATILRWMGVALVTLAVLPASAAAFTVTKETDTSDGTCDADCSLREAVTAANANPDQSTVDIPAGTYTLTIPNGGTETFPFTGNPAIGDLDITEDTTMTGAGARSTSVVAGEGFDDRILDIPGEIFLSDPPEITPSDANVDVSGVTIAGGTTNEVGGGILNAGTLSLSEVTLRDNTALFSGGAIRNDFNLTVDRSTLTANVVEAIESGEGGVGGGAGLFNNDEATVTNSTISRNRSGTFAGGVENFGVGANLNLSHTTINGNSAPSSSNLSNGDIPTEPPPDKAGAEGEGGTNQGVIRTRATIVSNPQGGGENCNGAPIDANGFNVEFPGTTCGFEIQADPMLMGLADNGGQTDTHGLRPGSPAIDAVNSAACPPPAVDQRGTARPQGIRCDVGAFERLLSASLSLSKAVRRPRVEVGDKAEFTLVAGNQGPDLARGVEIVDMLPAGVTLVSTSPGCSASERRVVCSVGAIPAGESRTRRITVRVDRTGQRTNRATLQADFPANPDNLVSVDFFGIQAVPPSPPPPASARCTIEGTSGNDILRGTPGRDVICGGDGNDVIYGLDGDDVLRGGRGADVLRGGAGDDEIDGGSDNDQLVGGNGDDSLTGGPGSDDLTGQGGRDDLDTSDGVRGNDVANGGPGDDSCSFDPGDERTSC